MPSPLGSILLILKRKRPHLYGEMGHFQPAQAHRRRPRSSRRVREPAPPGGDQQPMRQHGDQVRAVPPLFLAGLTTVTITSYQTDAIAIAMHTVR